MQTNKGWMRWLDPVINAEHGERKSTFAAPATAVGLYPFVCNACYGDSAVATCWVFYPQHVHHLAHTILSQVRNNTIRHHPYCHRDRQCQHLNNV